MGLLTVDYLDEVLNTPEAPQVAGNDKPIHGPSHQPSVESKCPYFRTLVLLVISDVEDIGSKSVDESSFSDFLSARETVETSCSINLVKIHYMAVTVSDRCPIGVNITAVFHQILT